MKNLTLKFILAIVLHLVVGVDAANALPPCTDPSKGDSPYRHNCEGTFFFPNGDKYVGAFKDDRFHGQGTYTSASGDKYVGAWKDGKRHGQGTFTYVNGQVDEGIWKADKFLYAQKAPASGKSPALRASPPRLSEPPRTAT